MQGTFAGSCVQHGRVGPVASRTACVRVRAATVAQPVQVEVKKLDGSSAGTAPVSLRVADADSYKGVVHRYLTYVRNSLRQGSANTKTRSEVRGGGKKPYAQKGNGTARRGSQRTPLRVGGGITFGPKPRDFSIDMNRKERRLAMATALQSAAGPSMVVAEDLSGWEQMKTKALVEALAGMGADPMQERVLIVTGQYNEALLRSARNVARLEACTVDNLNIIDVLKAKKIVMDKEALAQVLEFYGPEGEGFRSHYAAGEAAAAN